MNRPIVTSAARGRDGRAPSAHEPWGERPRAPRAAGGRDEAHNIPIAKLLPRRYDAQERRGISGSEGPAWRAPAGRDNTVRIALAASARR